MEKCIAHYTSKMKVVCYLLVHENLYERHPLRNCLF